MTHRDTLLPVDAFTVGLRDDELRGLVERHAVRFEVAPHHVRLPDAPSISKDGYVVELFGSRSASDVGLPSGRANDHVFEVLRALANAVLPSEEGPIAIDVESFAARTVMDPKQGFREEVPLRIVIRLETTAGQGSDGDPGAVTERISARLLALGARRKG